MKVLFGSYPTDLTERIPTFEARFPGVEFVYAPEKQEMLRAIADADVYLGQLDREAFLQAKKLKWIQASSSGVNRFLAIQELVEGEVLLTSASGTHGVSVAESAMAMILAQTRGIEESFHYQQKRTWVGPQIRKRLVVLKGATMGIIGCGAIGRALAQRARGFEMRVIAVDLDCAPTDGIDELWDMSRLDDLLSESDYVVVTVPQTKDTTNLIGEREIGLMKKSAMLVVMSRGGIVDEEALLRALREGCLAAAAMDVFKTEPLPPESEFWNTENLIMAPHIAGGSQFEADTLLEIFSENLDKFLRGDLPLRNQVDKIKQY